MTSLATRENLAGQVQMIYMDPPYGIKFGSNFQPLIGKSVVDNNSGSLTREPEQVRAYRDTWALGTHSYIEYLDRDSKLRPPCSTRRGVYLSKSATKTFIECESFLMRCLAILTL